MYPLLILEDLRVLIVPDGVLSKIAKWLSKKGPEHPNLTSLITCDSRKSVGKKQCKTSNARRKGRRNSKYQSFTTAVNHQALWPTTTSSTANPMNDRATNSSLPSSHVHHISDNTLQQPQSTQKPQLIIQQPQVASNQVYAPF